MRVLVTGAAGFAGRHLIRELLAYGHQCVAFDLNFSTSVPEGVEFYSGDLQDDDRVAKVVAEVTPDACVHLGGLAFVPAGKTHPSLMLTVNTGGTVNVLEAFREYAPEARILVVTSAQIYAPNEEGRPLRETDPLCPIGLYAVSKAAADVATLAYARRYGMWTMTARPNNHTGPGQAPQFVVPSFVRQVRAIAEGRHRPVIAVGNLDSERLFLDVRDVVRAYRLLLEKGESGQAYNISGQRMVRIRDVLYLLCEMANVRAEFVVDPERLRPTDRSPVLDLTRLQTATGWEPRIALEQTLRDMLSAP